MSVTHRDPLFDPGVTLTPIDRFPDGVFRAIFRISDSLHIGRAF